MRHRFRENPTATLAIATGRIAESFAHRGKGGNLIAWGGRASKIGAKNCRLAAG